MTEIVPFQPSDYDDAMALWRQTEGLALRGADSREAVLHYLKRNPGTSFVARERRTLLGAVLGGHDGRRGYLHHLAVAPSHRRRGVGRALAEHVLKALGTQGIHKCHLMVRADNTEALAFWAHLGWDQRADLVLMSRTEPTAPLGGDPMSGVVRC